MPEDSFHSEIYGKRILQFLPRISFVVKNLPALFAFEPVAEMDERGIEYHLIEGQIQFDGFLRELPHDPNVSVAISSERTHVGGLALGVLGSRNASDGFVYFRTPIAAVDCERFVPGITERLKDFINECLDAVADLRRSDCVPHLHSRYIRFFKLFVVKVFANSSHICFNLFVIQKRQPRNTGIAAPIKFVSKYKIMEFLSFRRPYVAVVLH